MAKVSVTGSCSMCWTYGHLFLINPVKMASWCCNR